MTREEREMSLVDKRVKREMATEVLYVLPRLTPARYGEEYPKKIEVKVLNISKKQTLEDMVHFNDEGWNEIGYVYNARERNHAFVLVNKYKAQLRKSPSVKRVI